MRLLLIRFGYLPTCTLGWLYTGAFRLATIEDAWRPDPDGPGGQRRDGPLAESCIPDGLYRIEAHNTTKHPDSWCMVNKGLGVYHWPGDIPVGQKYGRSACLLHAGNTEEAVEGCIALGEDHTINQGRHWITNSQAALARFKAALAGISDLELQIRPVTGTNEKL